LLDRAATAPARDLAGPLAAALRDLARLLGPTVDDGGLLAKLETESFSQGASSVPLSADLRSDTAGLLRRWDERGAAGKRARTQPGTQAAAMLAIVAGGLALVASPTGARAATPDDARRRLPRCDGRSSPTRTARKAAFARAEAAFGEAVRTTPDRPELLTDWGQRRAQRRRRRDRHARVPPRARDRRQQRPRAPQPRARAQPAGRYVPAAGRRRRRYAVVLPRVARARKLMVGSVAFAIAVLLVVPVVGSPAGAGSPASPCSRSRCGSRCSPRSCSRIATPTMRS